MTQDRRRRLVSSLLKSIFSLVALVLLVGGLGHSFGGLNPIGPLLSANEGLWRHQPTNASDVTKRLEQALKTAGLSSVQIEFDDDEVPHLQSENETSLYFAQGFVTSYYRLWQMDFLSRITAGRVAELLGSKALPIDRFFRRMRIPSAARASSELMMADPVTSGPLSAYTRGVNARLAQIDVTSLPIEYRLFGLKPETWSEERSAHLLKFMTWELTGYLYDSKMTASKAKISQELFDFLYPLSPNIPGTVLGERKTSATESMKSQSLGLERWSKIMADEPATVQPEPSNGSNNWAVPARLMSNRRPLLANDLHLGYTLPALWFSIQLTSPTMNVYGASLPGAPGVIVGFNETMGWAVTNGTDDVLDWYSLRFRDEKRQEYMFDDSWRPVITNDETIQVAGGTSETVRTRDTHVGPIVFEEGESEGIVQIPSGLAVQWTGSTPSNELKNFLLLNRSEKAKDCFEALRGYVAPAQNFVCADKFGNLTYNHAGLFPDRKGRDGRFIIEASSDDDLWQGWLKPEENPKWETSTDLIITANQAPFNGPDLFRYGWFFSAPFRSLQIRSLIEAKTRWTPEEMIEVQGSTTSLMSKLFKEVVLHESHQGFLKDALAGSISGFSLSPTDSSFEDTKWDSRIAATIDLWFKTLENDVWSRLVGTNIETYWPGRWRLIEIMQNEADVHPELWDDPKTEVIETLNFRLAEAFLKSEHEIRQKFGKDQKPLWSDYQPTIVRHAAKLPGLGRTIKAGGVAEAVFANKGQHGPTWKMIVTFEERPRAWTMIPGGQSGDPASASYDRLLEAWARGEMKSARFNMRSVDMRSAKPETRAAR